MAGANSQRRPRRSSRRAGAVVEAVRPLAERLASTLDVSLWDVEFAREAGRETLRVAVDRAGGVDAEELREFSERLSRELDETDAVPGDQRYWLEVTSPGAERKLHHPEQFGICAGRLVRITFRDGREPLVGEIAGADDDAVRVIADGDESTVRYDDISQAKLLVPGV